MSEHRLIDANNLIEYVWRERLDTMERIAHLVESMPTFEERKTGAWISDGVRFKGGHEWMHCSECGLEALDTPMKRTNYCPDCGVRMENPGETRRGC